MRKFIATIAMCLLPPAMAPACELTWADRTIPVPTEVATFIVAECVAARGSGEETVEDCIRAEGYGYRAVVTLLTDPLTGDRAIERYRICSGGLATLGGRFHRNKASCIGLPMGMQWRFEYTEETHIDPFTLKPHRRFAALANPNLSRQN